MKSTLLWPLSMHVPPSKAETCGLSMTKQLRPVYVSEVHSCTLMVTRHAVGLLSMHAGYGGGGEADADAPAISFARKSTSTDVPNGIGTGGGTLCRLMGKSLPPQLVPCLDIA